MPNQFLSDEFGDIEDYFVTDYWLIDQFVGDTLWAWGANGEGQLGDFSTTQRNIPVTTFAGGTNWKQISCGKFHTAAIKTDGSLWIWGAGGQGRLGNNATTDRSTPVTTFAGGNNWKQVSCGRSHTAAIKTDGSLWIWGNNVNGVLGINDLEIKSTPVTTFAGGNDWKSVSGGWRHTAAIKTDGSLWNWGRNLEGQLGTNDTDIKSTPVTTFAGGNDWKSVSLSSDNGAHIAAIKTDGSLWTWGANAYGQLGTNDTDIKSTPVTTFAGGNNWKQVACGEYHTAAIKTDGTLWGWGYNGYGHLGINESGGTTNRTTPVTTFSGGTNWKRVSAADNTFAVKTDGTLWTWGRGDSGRLGTNDSNNRNTPVTTFAGGNNWKQVACGYDYTVAIQSGLNVDLS